MEYFSTMPASAVGMTDPPPATTVTASRSACSVDVLKMTPFAPAARQTARTLRRCSLV